jgi:ABC-type glycerol-3-phosphate transport system substrate-binding protein
VSWRRLAWLALAAAALAASGCSPRERPPEVELWIADFNQDTRDLIDGELIPRFESAHPGVKVNTQYISWTHLDEKLTISFAGGVAPDPAITSQHPGTRASTRAASTASPISRHRGR